MRVFNIDITRKGISPVVQVTEYDAMSRFFTLVLRNGSSDYEPPENPTYSVWYKTKDSTGWYDTITLPDESTRPAVVSDGNAFTIEIAEQATTSCGELALMINGDDGYQLTVSGIITRSDDIPGYDGEEVENYYNVYITEMRENAARAENAADIAVAYGATVEVDEEAQQLNITHHSDTEGGVGWLFGSAVENSASGDPATFSDGADDVAVKSLVASITPVQSGTGDPSPTNIRPISGRTGMTVTVQSGETQNEYPVTWESIAGTVYGGTLDVVSGVLTVTHVFVSLFGIQYYWQKSGAYNGSFYISAANFANEYNVPPIKTFAPFVCSHAKTAKKTADYQFGGCYMDSSLSLWLLPADSTVDDFRNYLNAQVTAGTPVQVCCELETPQTYQLTPTEVRTLLGGNTIYTDAGDVSVEYIADTKLYIDNKIAELQALVLEN